MPDPLPVHVSRSDLHAIETVDSYETTGPFTVEIANHGRDAHVHLKLDDALARIAEQDGDGNYYVERDATRRVSVDVSPVEQPTGGAITVETGYGAESTTVGITVVPADETDVDVGADLGRPPADEDDEDEESLELPSPSIPEGAVPIAALAAVALAIAGLVALSVDSLVVVVGVAVVLVGVLAAAVILVK